MYSVVYNNFTLNFNVNFDSNINFMFSLIDTASSLSCDDPTRKQLVISAITKVIDENLNPELAKAFGHFHPDSLSMLVDVYVWGKKGKRVEDEFIKGKKIDLSQNVNVTM